jgi:hypothetical protein
MDLFRGPDSTALTCSTVPVRDEGELRNTVPLPVWPPVQGEHRGSIQ